ncbi:hypothetical protein GSI_14782 [Ganoderma sinense ZZ0214-1]|uniref:F-box domain-containing protein n=1 Tax=Ganoderma sinense ZZ0214-1 TaxID=1077348 RepID=A0A2G8RPQ2_9APHY|nr:hypothetical protein GSI_14782 [Ganoderma sinense ZZ0214-1]
MTPYRHTPVLRVCRYWRSLILKTPQFWTNILSLRLLYSRRLNWFGSRFKAALALSAPLRLTLSLPYWSMNVIDALLPHGSRIASLTLHCEPYPELSQRLFEQPLTHLRDLAIFYPFGSCPRDYLSLCFHLYPNIHSLRLRLTRFYSPSVPCVSLRHLDLTRCKIYAQGTTEYIPSYIPSMSSLHGALELFPNLETLCLSDSLSEPYHYADEPPELTKTVHLPHLRRVDIQDKLTYISQFLSHLSIPATTDLMLHPDYKLGRPVRAPVFPSIHFSPGSPDTEISLHIDFWYNSSWHRSLGWGLRRPGETGEDQVQDVGMVRIALSSMHDPIGPIMHFTRGIARALAPSLSTGGVTKLTVTGTHASGREFWTAVLPDLPGLRRIVCEDIRSTEVLVDVLGRPFPVELGSGDADSGSGFPCPGLADLALVWKLPNSLVEEQDCCDDGGTRQNANGYLRCEVVSALGALCNALRACLAARRAGRRCEAIRKLTVALRNSHHNRILVLEWEAELVERHLREGLANLVEEIAVVDNVEGD